MTHTFSLLPLAIIQAMMLAGGQILMKLALAHMGPFSWSWRFIHSQLTNWWWLACGICFGGASLLWLYILKHYPFSVAYPLSSMAYIFGMIAASIFFHEQVSVSGWLGVLLIVLGSFLVTR